MEGIFSDISNEDYHAMDEYISNSYLSRIDHCPAAARVVQEETPAMVFGSALHCLLLEGEEAFYQEFIVPPKIDMRTNAGKQMAADIAATGLTWVKEEDFECMKGIVNAVTTHPIASVLMKEGISEQSVFWTDRETGMLCKCRPDRIPDGDKGVIVDIKTTKDAAYQAFTNSVIKFGYHRQAAFYLNGYNAASGKEADAFVFVACEREIPYRVEVYAMSADFVEYGKSEVRRLMLVEKACREGGYYPHYVTTDIREIYVPGWVR